MIVLSVGPAEAEKEIRSALALGCDEGVLLTDPAFGHSDTYATSYILAAAIKKLAEKKGAVHLALFGKQTNDGESGHMGPEVAAWLAWPSVTSVRKIPAVSESEHAG